jgi:hypothetical protein
MYAVDALTSLLIWASTEAWIIIVVGCVPPIRPLMERVLQHLGLTSKKTETPYHLQSARNYADHANVHSTAYGGRRTLGRSNDRSWMELTAAGGPGGSDEQIVGAGKDVLVTTNIETHYEDVGGRDTRPSSESHVSGDDPAREPTWDAQRVV